MSLTVDQIKIKHELNDLLDCIRQIKESIEYIDKLSVEFDKNKDEIYIETSDIYCVAEHIQDTTSSIQEILKA